MWDRRRRNKALTRIRPGNGRPLKPFRWWQLLSRSVFHLPASPADDAAQPRYTIDVPYWQRISTQDGKGRAHLYLNDHHHADSTFPAAFPVDGGFIEVVPSSFGLRRCHYLPDHGPERQLVPDPHTAEGRRDRLARGRPWFSRCLGALSLLVLLTAAALALPQLWEPLSTIPPVADRLGEPESPIALPLWANCAIALAAATASVERATRLRHHWLDNLAQG